MNGFVKLYRSMLDWEWYTDTNVKSLFIHLLLKCNYEPKKWRGVEIEKGQFVTSLKNLSEETGLTSREVRTALDKLSETGEIETSATNKFTLIKVVNFSKFQAVELGSDKQTTNERQTKDNEKAKESQTNDKQTTTTKEIKEREEIKENKEREETKNNSVYQLIVDMYNDTCVSFPKCTKLSEARKKGLRARLRKYTVEDFKLMFEKAEKSDFLKGANSRNWVANFDWFISDRNFVKVIDGNFDNTSPSPVATAYKQNQNQNVFLDIAKEEGLF